MIDITNRQHSQRLCFVLRIFVEQKWSVRKMFEWFAFKLNKISLFFIPKFTWNLEFVHDFIHILLIPVHVFVLQLNIMLLWCRFFLAVPFSEWGEKHKQKQSPIICCAVRCVANWNKRLWKKVRPWQSKCGREQNDHAVWFYAVYKSRGSFQLERNRQITLVIAIV